MGFERFNNGRYPFLLGGCVLLFIMLVCNWWSYSTQNYELIKQIDEISKSMKICSNDRNQCTEELANLNKNYGKLKIQISQQKTFYENAIDRQDKDITLCRSELESLKNLDASKNESLKTLRSDIAEKKEEIKELQEKIKTTQQKLDEVILINQQGAQEKGADMKTESEPKLN